MGDSKVKGVASATEAEKPFTDSGMGSIFEAKKGPQILCCFVATLGSFGLGHVLGWTSPALPDLALRQDLGLITSSESSWIAALAVLGALLSGPATGYLINRLGRRLTILILALPFLLGWLLIGFAQNVLMIYFGRFITGFAGGSFTVTVPVYVSEIAQDSIRGTLGSAMVLTLVSGILFTYVVGTFIAWNVLALICAAVPAMLFLGMLFMPESPRYLLTKGRLTDATKSLQWLRGASDQTQIEPELTQLRLSIDLCKTRSPVSSWRNLFKPSILKPTLIVLALMLFQQLSGINAVQFYTVDIFRSAGPHIDPNLAAIIIGIVQVVCVMLSMILVDRVGRKALLITSDVVMTVGLVALGYFFYVKDTLNPEELHALAWLPLVSLVSFVIAYSVGVGPLPWLLLGELIPPHVRGPVAAIVTSFYWSLAFLATKTFEDLAKLVGWHGCYWVFAVICAAGGLFTLFLIPETKGKSSEEIQRYFGAEIRRPSARPRDEEMMFLKGEKYEIDIDNNVNLNNGPVDKV